MDSIQEFKEKGYVHLKDFLHKDSCKELANELKRLVSENKTVKDVQCPKSEAIHGTVTFDKLLEDLTPHFEAESGLKLFPTYSYARLYNNQGIVFPSFMPHGVEPVTKGIRYSVVTWMVGPYFK